MSAKVIRLCEDGHGRVIYYTSSCPVCDALTAAEGLKDQVYSYELEIQEYRAAQSSN